MEMFKYLLFTLLVEIPVVLIAYSKDWKTVVGISSLLNLFTWPLLTLLYHYTKIPLLVLEAGVFASEAVGYKIFLETKWLKALLVSFIANAASLLIGIWINGINLLA